VSSGNPGPVSAAVSAWIESVTAEAVTKVEELTGGASRSSFIVTGERGTRWFLRVDSGRGPMSGTPFTLAREFDMLRHLQGGAVPVPGVYAHSPDHNAMLMEFVAGHTSYQWIGTEEEERSLRRELMAAVVALQRVPTGSLAFLGQHCSEPLGRAIPADLAIWRQLYDERVTIRDPLIEFGLNWLVQSVPDSDAHPVVVHGDVGAGNFMIADGHLRALIDWELVRVGHPLEDLACIIARSLGAPFGSPTENIRNYEALTGKRVDLRHLDYAMALIVTRWLIGIQMALSRPSAQQNVPMLFAFRQLNGRALVDALCRCYGIAGVGGSADVAATGPGLGATAAAADRISGPSLVVFGYSAECLEIMAAADALAVADRYRLKGLRDLLAYLRSFIAYGPETYDRESVDRASTLVGRQLRTVREANDAVCQLARTIRASDAGPLVEHLRWRSQREHAIMRESLNERADNAIEY
jgi:aminoglycoside phosphotransferase (APT) family kinase protein